MAALRRTCFAAVLCLVVVASATAAPVDADLESRVDKIVGEEIRRQKIPGVAVGVFQQGEPLLLKGYGYADIEHRVPVRPETVFQSASIGKQFTAVAVMLQVEDGKLALDDSFRKHFPDAPESWQPITVRHLLTHTSGIPDYFEAMGKHGTEEFDVRRDYPPDELRHIFYKLPLDFEAGSDWHYSNTGYALLGFLVLRVSGQFYGDVLKDRVFSPLGMRTAQVISEADIVPNRAAGYQLIDGQINNQEWYAPLVNTTADGALYLSLLDYLAWDRGLRDRAILTAASWDAIYTPVGLSGNRIYPYGFGWNIGQSQDAPWYYHSGSSQGFNLYLSRYIASDLTIVALTNLNESSPASIVDRIAESIDPRLAKVLPADENN
jgi:CubicO group peptidase (beta-lactamase class C family)